MPISYIHKRADEEKQRKEKNKERTEQLIAVVNNSAKTAQLLVVFFLVLALLQAFTLVSVSDKELFFVNSLTIPH